MSGLTTTHSFPVTLEDGSTVRIEGTTHTEGGERILFDADGHAYSVGRVALKHVRRPEHDREPLGTSYAEPVEPNTLLVDVYDGPGGPVGRVLVTKTGGGGHEGPREYVDADGKLYRQRTVEGGGTAKLTGVVIYREVPPLT